MNRKYIDRLQDSGTNTIGIVNITGSNGYIDGSFFPRDIRCYKAILQVVSILIVELPFVYFTCQRAIYIVDVNGCTISAGYLRKQLIIRVIFVIYRVSDSRNRFNLLCTDLPPSGFHSSDGKGCHRCN